MKKWRSSKGFTLAEVLLTVAIIVILMGVSFVGVQSYQRSMTRLEFDAIAKEIFIAAQNHLTTAASQGYLQNEETKYGYPGTLNEDKNKFDSSQTEAWYVLNDGQYGEARNLLLPNYAVDATVLGGSYLIRYQPSSASVLDVFYTRADKTSLLTLTGTRFTSDDYGILMQKSGDDYTYKGGSERNREHYNGTNAIIGWYGGEGLADTGERLRVPTFEIINAEKLLVKVNDPNSDLDFASLKLILTGESSTAEKIITLIKNNTHLTEVPARVQYPDSEERNNLYTVILDDITVDTSVNKADLRFQKLEADTGVFIPGEDVSIQLVAYSNTKRANIAFSEKLTTNSLFANPDSNTADTMVDGSNIKNGIAAIANIRHLENLDNKVSDFNLSRITSDENSAKQLTDLTWADFKSKTNGADTAIQYESTSTDKECFYPVSPLSNLSYDGQKHTISDVKVNFAGSSGLFGTLEEGSKVENLKLIDFEITGTTSAGALVGSAANTTITNVVAYNSKENDSKFDNDETTDKKPNVTASGAAGGLIGSMTGGKAEKSAAAVYVNGGTEAGGLIGSVTGDNNIVTACYSGGHTYSGDPKYAEGEKPDPVRTPNAVRYYDANNYPMYNVIAASGTAGGLIGSAGTATISNSYSTCSASGTTAGGFVGTGGAITDCYCTGLVKGTTAEGAFAASVNSVNGSLFFEIINERSNTDSGSQPAPGYNYLKPIGNAEASATTGVTAFDASVNVYDTFSGGPTNWKKAEAYPYDAGGTESYGLKVIYKVDGKTCYNFPTVEKLNQSGSVENKIEIKEDDFVKAPYSHYGDWPVPEEFIFN